MMMSTAWWDFSHKKALVIGDVMLDRYWAGPCRRISPEAPVPVVNVQSHEVRLGGAANTAANLKALKMRCTLLGAVGDDEAGRQIVALCEQQGFDFRPIVVPDYTTTVKLRLSAGSQQLARMDFEQQCPDQLLAIQAYLQAHLSEYDIVILSDYAKGLLQSSRDIIQYVVEKGVPVFVDPKVADYSAYQGATLLKPNLKEFTEIVGLCESESDLAEKGLLLKQKYAFSHLLVTRGSQGMSLLEQDKAPLHLPTQANEVFDVSGAGDTVMAVLAACYASGLSLEHCVHLANIGAGIVIAKVGTAMLTCEELRAAVEQTHHKGTVISEDELESVLSGARSKGERIVMTNGCFDLLHAGHVRCLQEAASFGDKLIVAVNTDESVQRLKGPSRPLNRLQDRMAVLAGLGCVDWVVAFDDDTPQALIEKVQPDVLVKGGDYKVSEIVGSQTVLAAGGQVKVVQLLEGRSTTSTIAKIQDSGKEITI